MQTVLSALLVILMLATLGVLIAGMVGLVRPNQDPARSNRLMRWRVVLQAGALLMFVLLVSLLRH